MDAQGRDRRVLLAAASAVLLGLASIGLGVWWSFGEPLPEWTPVHAAGGPFGGIVGGVILVAFSVHAVVHRLRRGPQPQGRHSG